LEYCRQIFWSSGIDLPKDFERLIEDITLEAVEFPPGKKAPDYPLHTSAMMTR